MYAPEEALLSARAACTNPWRAPREPAELLGFQSLTCRSPTRASVALHVPGSFSVARGARHSLLPYSGTAEHPEIIADRQTAGGNPCLSATAW